MTKKINLKRFSFFFFLFSLTFTQSIFASEEPNYFYSNGKKIFLGIITNKSEDNINFAKRFLNITNQETITKPSLYRETETGDELIVKKDFLASFSNNLTDEEISEIIDKELNSEIIQKLNYVLDGKGYYLRLKDPSDNVISVSNKCVESMSCIWAHPNFTRKISLNALPPDTYTSLQWHLKNTGQNGGVTGADINIEKAWEKTKGNSNITVAVIDDSFDWHHEEFNSQAKIAKKFNLVQGGTDTRLIANESSQIKSVLDIIGSGVISHGTLVGGLIAAPENGVGIVGTCPNCMLMPIKIADSISGSDGKLSYLSVEDKTASDAIALATDQGADIINNSWTGVFSDVLRNAIDYAQRKGRDGKGAIVVFSAGNGLKTSCQTSSVYPPANYLPVITVGATDKNDMITCYSSTGPEIDLVAPGGDQIGDIITTDLVGTLGYSPKNISDTLKLTSLGLNEPWQLQLYDLFFRSTGVLNNWSLDFVDINNATYKFESSSKSLPIPDGLGSVIASPGTPLITTVKPSLSNLPLIKDIFLNLDITHSNGADLEGVLIKPSSENLVLSKLSPASFPQSGSFIPINKLNLAHANNLPVFDLDNKGNYTNSFGGTSASSAIVSGIAGLILSINPNLTYSQVDQILKATADKIDQTNALYDANGHSNIYGAGRVNAYKALLKAEELLKTNSQGLVSDNSSTGNTNSSTTSMINENEPNNNVTTAQTINIPSTIQGSASVSDIGEIQIVSDKGKTSIITDLYKIEITEPTEIKANLIIASTSTQDNLDLVLLDKSTTSLIDSSFKPGNTSEFIQRLLQPGIYYFGVVASTGSSSYTLSISKSLLLSINIEDPSKNPNANGGGTSIIPSLKINSEDVFVLLPELKNYTIKLEAEAVSFKSPNKCTTHISIDSELKTLKVIPRRFLLSPKKSKKKIRIEIPYNRATSLVKNNSSKTVTLDVKCTNGSSAKKSILVKPQDSPK